MSAFVTSIITEISDAITPSDSTDNVPKQARGIHNNSATSGFVYFNDKRGNTRHIYLNAGDFIEIKVTRIRSTSTTAGAVSWFT